MHGSKIFGPEQTVVLQIWQKKTTKILTCTTFLYMISLRNKIVAHKFYPSFDNANGTIEIQKLRHHGNLTSHFSPPTRVYPLFSPPLSGRQTLDTLILALF